MRYKLYFQNGGRLHFIYKTKKSGYEELGLAAAAVNPKYAGTIDIVIIRYYPKDEDGSFHALHGSVAAIRPAQSGNWTYFTNKDDS